MTSNYGRESVDWCDLPDECVLDHAVIYPLNEPGQPSFELVCFVHRDTFESGRKWYHEPIDYKVTNRVKKAIKERTDVPIDDLKLEREIPKHEIL